MQLLIFPKSIFLVLLYVYLCWIAIINFIGCFLFQLLFNGFMWINKCNFTSYMSDFYRRFGRKIENPLGKLKNPIEFLEKSCCNLPPWFSICDLIFIRIFKIWPDFYYFQLKLFFYINYKYIIHNFNEIWYSNAKILNSNRKNKKNQDFVQNSEIIIQ